MKGGAQGRKSAKARGPVCARAHGPERGLTPAAGVRAFPRGVKTVLSFIRAEAPGNRGRKGLRKGFKQEGGGVGAVAQVARPD